MIFSVLFGLCDGGGLIVAEFRAGHALQELTFEHRLLSALVYEGTV